MNQLKNLISLIVLSFMTISLLSQSVSNADYNKLMQEFQLQTEKWKQAYNSHDAQNFVSLYSEDARYISSHVEGLEAPDRNKLIANFQNGMNMGGHIDSIKYVNCYLTGQIWPICSVFQLNW